MTTDQADREQVFPSAYRQVVRIFSQARAVRP